MTTPLETIRDQQKASWDKFSSGWRKWDEFATAFHRPVGDEIVKSLQLTQTDTVLDIASGTGEPGLSIAKMTHGRVVLTDLSDNMLEGARDKARTLGLTNVETYACDVSKLPFADNTFDAVSCRFGFMFFPDMQQAANEMARVLKPGGRVAASVWGSPEKNVWITAIGSTIQKIMQLPPPLPGAPGIFRCAVPGMIEGLFSNAGLSNTAEHEIAGRHDFGSFEFYWEYMTDIAAPVVAALANADAQTIARIKQGVMDTMKEKYPDGSVAIDFSATVVTAQK